MPTESQKHERVLVAATKASPATDEPVKRTATKAPAKRPAAKSANGAKGAKSAAPAKRATKTTARAAKADAPTRVSFFGEGLFAPTLLAYGTQEQSFEAALEIDALGGAPFPGVFIRAPVIETVGPTVEVLAVHEGRTVLCRQGSWWGSTFHPELSGDLRVHELFLAQAA